MWKKVQQQFYAPALKATGVELSFTNARKLHVFSAFKKQCKNESTTIPKKVLDLMDAYLSSQKSDNESYTISLPITLTRSKLSDKQTNETYVLDDKGNKF